MRHAPVDPEVGYGSCIPGHVHLANQSVNSHAINRFGVPRDVLYNIKNGEHFWDMEIACFRVGDVHQVDEPNENTTKYRDRAKTIILKQDRFTFRVEHDPENEMYPHCIVRAHRNGKPTNNVPDTMATVIQRKFAKLAKERAEMMKRHNTPGLPSSCGILAYVGFSAWLALTMLQQGINRFIRAWEEA
jgi:hypothetical protein